MIRPAEGGPLNEIGMSNVVEKLEADRTNNLFEKSKECEITRYNVTNKSTFLHIFDYQQNKELKK